MKTRFHAGALVCSRFAVAVLPALNRSPLVVLNPGLGESIEFVTTVDGTDGGPLAINSAGQLWFGDENYTNTVKGYTSSGQPVGARFSISSYTPNALAFDTSGRLWLGGTNTVAAYNTSTGALIGGTTITDACLAAVAAIRFDPSGNILVLNGAANMCVYSSAGALQATIAFPTITSSYVDDMAISP